MNWDEALLLIIQNIQIGTNLDNNSQYRIVEQIPPYECFRYNFNGENGFRISVGNNQSIDIPISMLQNVFESAHNENNHIYEKSVLEELYPRQTNNKPCYVHSIGKLFVCADIAVPNGARKYNLL